MRIVLIVAASIVGLSACASEAKDEPRRPWTFVYHLAYDGSLDQWSDDVVMRLARNTDGRGPAVVVQLDRRDALGMTRWTFDGGPATEQRLRSEAGADPAAITALLEHAEAHVPAERYAVFLVGHGGALGQYGYDEHPEPGGPRWMDLGAAARAIARFDDETEGVVELLYLQQCGRAHLATLADVGVAASVILAAQGNVGAPNAYYGAALASLTVRPTDDGARLAQTIIETEVPTMFQDLVAYDGAALRDELAVRFAPVRAAIDPPRVDGAETVYANAGRRYVDMKPWLHAAYDAAGLDRAPADDFLRWFEREVVLTRRASPMTRRANEWSGASLREAEPLVDELVVVGRTGS